MTTQWRSGMAVATGLDYAALPAAAAGLGLQVTRKRFAGLRVMEAAALKALAKRRE